MAALALHRGTHRISVTLVTAAATLACLCLGVTAPATAGPPVAAAPQALTPQAAAPQAAAPTPQAPVTPSITWSPCPTSDSPTRQCGTLAVPYDYANPGGPKFTLAVAKVPATGTKTGSLFFNPGGPGGPGAAYVGYVANQMPANVRQQFDVVSWDPRGIGSTQPALQNCAEPRLTLPATGKVDWVAARAASETVAAAANRACAESNATFINYIGTNNAARDLDQLRAAVGDTKLTYWGLSYGTRIGYVYALMFPDRIRAMVLDGNIDPMGNYAGLTEGGVALDSALLFMRSADPTTHSSFMTTLKGLETSPIELGGGAQYTRWHYLTTLAGAIPDEGSWRDIRVFNDTVASARLATPTGDAARARLRTMLGATDGNLGGPFSVVNCLDYADRMTPAAQNAAIKRNALVAPVYGGMITGEYALGCSGLNLRPDPVATTRSLANLAKLKNLPVVIANSTNDGSTPMLWALRMRTSFAKATLVTYVGGQHGLWQLTGSSCVNDRITNYVVSLQRPSTAICRNTPPPPVASGSVITPESTPVPQPVFPKLKLPSAGL